MGVMHRVRSVGMKNPLHIPTTSTNLTHSPPSTTLCLHCRPIVVLDSRLCVQHVRPLPAAHTGDPPPQRPQHHCAQPLRSVRPAGTGTLRVYHPTVSRGCARLTEVPAHSLVPHRLRLSGRMPRCVNACLGSCPPRCQAPDSCNHARVAWREDLRAAAKKVCGPEIKAGESGG